MTSQMRLGKGSRHQIGTSRHHLLRVGEAGRLSACCRVEVDPELDHSGELATRANKRLTSFDKLGGARWIFTTQDGNSADAPQEQERPESVASYRARLCLDWRLTLKKANSPIVFITDLSFDLIAPCSHETNLV